jgi:serine/threonine protein kinase
MSGNRRSFDPSRYTRIGRYEVQAHIATGGMGIVYKAIDTEQGRPVALKVLPARLAAQPDKLERFRREANHGVRLRHKNIVRIFEFGEVSGTYFLVSEFVDGIDLHQHIQQKGQLGPREAYRILIQALRGLNYLHKRGMVHRDVKPANLLLTRRDDELLVKLADLGLVRELWGDEEFRVTREGTTVGTVDYMAPEQARDSSLADIRSDIYSLGCTWFQMLSGKPPFASGTLIERLYKHIEAEPPDIRQLNSRVPERMAAILQRMLAKKPADRYPSPAELLRDLVRSRQRPPAVCSPQEVLTPPPKKQWPAPLPDPSRGRTDLQSVPASRTDLQSVPQEAAPTETVEKKQPAAPTEYRVAGEKEAGLLPAIQPEHQQAAAGQFERAREVLADGNHEYGIHLLLSCCKLDPNNLEYRRVLRQTEKTKYANNRRGGRFAWLTSLPARTRLKNAKRAKEYVKVLAHGEEVLVHNPWEVSTHMDMAEAAEALGLTQLAVWLLEEARDKDALHGDLNRALALLYEERGDFSQAIALWELVRKAEPGDLEACQKITDLAASETLARVRSKEAKRRAARRASSQ